jgi:sarcosine oxidase subunit beta
LINAAGAWAGFTAMLAGLNIPVRPLKRQVACMNKENILPENLPMTIFVKDSFHFRTRDKKLILLMPTDNEISDPLDMTVEDKWLENIGKIAKSRIPVLDNSDYVIDKNLSWAGLYEMSPDEHVLLGLAPGFENFYLANGSSGHGVMHSPAIGQLLAELITYNKTTIDVTPLRPSRFSEGEPIESIKFF